MDKVGAAAAVVMSMEVVEEEDEEEDGTSMAMVEAEVDGEATEDGKQSAVLRRERGERKSERLNVRGLGMREVK